MGLLSFVKRAIGRATGRELSTKAYRYKVTKDDRGGFEYLGTEQDFTPIVALEMAFIAISRAEEFNGDVEVSEKDYEQREGVACVAVALEILNHHFPDRPNVGFRHDNRIIVHDEDIETMLDAYYSPNSLAIVREIPPSFRRENKGMKF